MSLISLSFTAEKRAFLLSPIDKVAEKILDLEAEDLGDYAFVDHIFGKDDINSEVIRIREYMKSQYQHAQFVMHYKVRELKEGNHSFPWEREFDSYKEALNSVPQEFKPKLHFFRKGREYLLREAHLQLEEIEGMPPSLEIVAPKISDINQIFQSLPTGQILEVSVPKYLELKEKNSF